MEHDKLGEKDKETERIEERIDIAASPTTLTLDVEKYEYFFENTELTALQKHEYLQALWSILVNLIRLGVEMQPARQDCGKPDTRFDCRTNAASSMVESGSQNLDSKFIRAADGSHDPAARGSPK